MKKTPISFKESQEVIHALNMIFKVPKIRQPNIQTNGHNAQMLRDEWNNYKKEFFPKSLSSGPFDGYVFDGDDWHVFIKTVFSRTRSYVSELLGFHQNAMEDLRHFPGVERKISLEELKEGVPLILKYLNTVESLSHSYILFIGDTEGYRGFLLEEVVDKSREMEATLTHPVFDFVGLDRRFHLSFLQYIMRVFLNKRGRDSEEQTKNFRKLSIQFSKLQEKYGNTIVSLQDATRKNAMKNISVPTEDKNTVKLEKENENLRAILGELGYSSENGITPTEWLRDRDQKMMEGRSFEWQSLALEEAHRADTMHQKTMEQDSYITFLECKFNGVHESLEKQYQQERWNTGKMELNEMMAYISENYEIARVISPHIIDFINNLTLQINGISLSSTGNGNVGVWSGHTANIILSPLLGFIRERVKKERYEYLNLSWRKIVENYIKDSGWNETEGNCPSFSLLLNHLPDEPGNITNIKALSVWLLAIQKTLNAEHGGMCKILEKLFGERMTVLQRQIGKNGKNGQ